jgi:hypothetical protein
MRRLHIVLIRVAVGASVTVTSHAFADGTDPAGADALFQVGRAAADRGDWETACPKFAESQRLDPAPGTLLNLADCEEHVGHVATASEHFREALDQLPAGDDRIDFAKQHVAALAPRVPHLSIFLAANAPFDTTILRDDVQVGRASLGVPLPLDPGQHALTVSAAGRPPAHYVVKLAEGQASRIDVAPGAAPDEPEAEASPPQQAPTTPVSPAAAQISPEQRRTLAYVIGGAGAASLLVSIVTGFMALGAKGTMSEHCTASNACDSTGMDAASSGRTFSTISTIAFLAGAAGVGVGGYFFVTSSDSGQAATTASRSAPRGVGLAIGGRF